jgi:hypothetical protein
LTRYSLVIGSLRRVIRVLIRTACTLGKARRLPRAGRRRLVVLIPLLRCAGIRLLTRLLGVRRRLPGLLLRLLLVILRRLLLPGLLLRLRSRRLLLGRLLLRRLLLRRLLALLLL